MPGTSKPCHNCRRRRLRCDRSWPTCHKCAVSGQECLGYGKVFVWTQAIDARGNLKPSPSRRTPLGGPLSSSSGPTFSSATNSYFPPFSDPVSGRRPDTGPGNQAHDAFVRDGGSVPGGVQQAFVRRPSPLNGTRGNATMSAAPEPAKDAASSSNQMALPGHRKWMPPALGSLTDPLFQDLDRNSRYYLAHCKRLPNPETAQISRTIGCEVFTNLFKSC